MTTIVMLLLAAAFMLTIFAYLAVETPHHAASSARMSKVAVERPGRWR